MNLWVLRAATPTRPDQSVTVRVRVRMVIVPYVGVFSLSADVSRVIEVKVEEDSNTKKEKEVKETVWSRVKSAVRKVGRRKKDPEKVREVVKDADPSKEILNDKAGQKEEKTSTLAKAQPKASSFSKGEATVSPGRTPSVLQSPVYNILARRHMEGKTRAV